MLGYFHYWHGDGPAPLREHGVHCIAPYALQPAQLSRYRGLLLPARADQRHLQTLREPLEDWLAGGGRLVINGHVAHPFLRWLREFEPSPTRGLEGLRVALAQPHPVFEGVAADDLTFRRGVAGFYARGANPPPPGAQVLNTLGPQRQPIDWLLALRGGGRLLVHSGNDIWTQGGTAQRVLPQLLAWLRGPEA